MSHMLDDRDLAALHKSLEVKQQELLRVVQKELTYAW